VFLQPVSIEMGWSRAGISAALMLAFLCMGISSFAWGAASDRYGTRVVVLAGGVLLGLGLGAASQALELWQFQALFGVLVGTAAGSSYAPLIATVTNWFDQHRSLAVALVSLGLGVGTITVAPLATWLILSTGWRTAMLVLGGIALGDRPTCRVTIAPPAYTVGRTADGFRLRYLLEGRGCASNPAIRCRGRDLLRVLRSAFGPDLSHGELCTGLRYPGAGSYHRVQRRGLGRACWPHRLRHHRRPSWGQARSYRWAGRSGESGYSFTLLPTTSQVSTRCRPCLGWLMVE
jgi:MFS family permease